MLYMIVFIYLITTSFYLITTVTCDCPYPIPPLPNLAIGVELLDHMVVLVFIF